MCLKGNWLSIAQYIPQSRMSSLRLEGGLKTVFFGPVDPKIKASKLKEILDLGIPGIESVGIKTILHKAETTSLWAKIDF